MLSDDAFEREKRAYRLVQKSMARMLASGYEVRWFDNVPRLELDLLFVGPATTGEKPDVQKLVLPYEFVSLLVAEDATAAAELNWHMTRVKEASRQLHAFLHEQILRKLEMKNGSDDHGQGHQA